MVPGIAAVAEMLRRTGAGFVIKVTRVTGGFDGFAARLLGDANTDMVLADDETLGKLKDDERFASHLRDLFCL